jgi:glycosyltransferase involved in cell wall biosynthesis
MNWICSQIGAREHYAIPRALHEDGRLATLYTDYWAGALVRAVASTSGVGVLRSLAARFDQELATAAICSWNTRSLLSEMTNRPRNGVNLYPQFVETGSVFAIRMRERLKRRQDLSADSILFAYDTGALEALDYCRSLGVRCILGQIDPNRVEVELVREEEKSWPGWSEQPMDVPEAYFRRREQEWALADIVMVNSDFCREALLKQGVPDAKLAVVPLCFEAGSRPPSFRLCQDSGGQAALRPPSSVLRVLFLGQVVLRKGIQYLMEAARILKAENIQFDVVGPIGISEAAVKLAPKNMVFHGRATRDQTANWYQQSDVFVLPTLSDGFALTQLEAMSFGLPVVTTPNCGAVVSDGVDGFIVPPRDAEALARAFQRYLSEPELLASQRPAALEKVKQFSLDHLAANLQALEARLDSRSP